MEVVEACPENSLADSPRAGYSPVPQTWRPPRCSVSTARRGVHSTAGPLSLVASLQSPVSLCATDAPLGRFHVHACTLLLKRLWVLVLLLHLRPPLAPPHTCLSRHPPSTGSSERSLISGCLSSSCLDLVDRWLQWSRAEQLIMDKSPE